MAEHNQPNNEEQANANKTLPENVLLGIFLNINK